MTKQVVMTGREASGEISFSPGGAGFGGKLGGKVTSSATLTDGKEENHQRERSLDVSSPYNIGAMTEQTIEHLWIRREVPVHYHGTAMVFGELAPCHLRRRRSIRRIMQILKIFEL
jgi:hypothetical protein